ncbi:uncharacterized protein TNCV_277191 [Trichonephila clavipes]|uniref:Uncharacterized protein n=1 Tax=Trichonephila clavipes TaxID=2585209 RepID=A0A8X6S479_TRICX|nr:uncharacterized protein TNCV_277191 [Trichonephila clavipes]
MDEDRTTKKVFNAQPMGTRRKDRPNLKWIDDLEKKLLVLSTINWRTLARRRQCWKRLLEKSKAYPGLSHLDDDDDDGKESDRGGKPHRKNVPEISSFLDSRVEMNQITKRSSLDYPLFCVERETEEKIARQLCYESELNELRLQIESIRSNVKRTSCAEDRKNTSSNYRISIGRAGNIETSPAVLMAEAKIPVTTPIKEENGMDDLRVVYVKVKGEQEMANAVMDTGAQMPVVRPDVVEGQSIDNSVQVTSAAKKWVIPTWN